MRWEDYRSSDNVFNRRGEGGSAGAGFGGAGGGMIAFMLLRMIFSRFGIGGVVVAVGGFFLLSALGMNPLAVSGSGQQVRPGPSGEAPTSRYDAEIATILATTEDVWNDVFASQGADYPEPALNLFAGGINAGGCGFASAAVGPFYCPANREIYIDTSFFEQLERQLGAPGDFARAYVIAHEVGHHIQTVTGVSDQVRAAQARARTDAERNDYSVRLELMADCLAGVWARRAQGLDGFALEEGDIQEGLRAAAMIGDDTLQRRAGRQANAESFTHGTSEQRQRWLSIGYRTGDPDACDTLSAREL